MNIKGSQGILGFLFPSSQVGWQKNKGAIREGPFSQGSLACHMGQAADVGLDDL